MSIDKHKARKFILVLHAWFVDSKGFDYQEFTGSWEEARREAALWQVEAQGACHKTEVIAIPIREEETIYEPYKKLTWYERISGKLAPWRKQPTSAILKQLKDSFEHDRDECLDKNLLKLACSITMVADPFPGSLQQNLIWLSWLNKQAKCHGFKDWTEAYHKL